MINLDGQLGSTSGVAQPDGAARHAKLQKASQEFEAMMLQNILKPLSTGSAIGEEGDSDSGGPLQSFGIQAMASQMAKSGALGFAEKITKAVEKHNGGAAAPAGSGDSAGVAVDSKEVTKNVWTGAQVRLPYADKANGGTSQ